MKLFEKIRTHNHILTRIFFVLCLTLTIFLAKPLQISAEGGTFSCDIGYPLGGGHSCEVGQNNCDSNYEPNESVCTSITVGVKNGPGWNSCINTTGTQCTKTSEETEGETVNPKQGCTEGINTALGCIPYKTGAFTSSLLEFAVGIAGGIAFLIMIVGAFIMMTGGNNPEQVQKGKEIITSAIIGLLFIIFSAVILRIIAGDIIQLKGI